MTAACPVAHMALGLWPSTSDGFFRFALAFPVVGSTFTAAFVPGTRCSEVIARMGLVACVLAVCPLRPGLDVYQLAALGTSAALAPLAVQATHAWRRRRLFAPAPPGAEPPTGGGGGAGTPWWTLSSALTALVVVYAMLLLPSDLGLHLVSLSWPPAAQRVRAFYAARAGGALSAFQGRCFTMACVSVAIAWRYAGDYARNVFPAPPHVDRRRLAAIADLRLFLVISAVPLMILIVLEEDAALRAWRVMQAAVPPAILVFIPSHKSAAYQHPRWVNVGPCLFCLLSDRTCLFRVWVLIVRVCVTLLSL